MKYLLPILLLFPQLTFSEEDSINSYCQIEGWKGESIRLKDTKNNRSAALDAIDWIGKENCSSGDVVYITAIKYIRSWQMVVKFCDMNKQIFVDQTQAGGSDHVVCIFSEERHRTNTLPSR